MNDLLVVIGSVTAEQYQPIRLQLLRDGKRPKVVRLPVEKLVELYDESDLEGTESILEDAEYAKHLVSLATQLFGISAEDSLHFIISEDVDNFISDPVRSPDAVRELWAQTGHFFPNMEAFWVIHDGWAEDGYNDDRLELN